MPDVFIPALSQTRVLPLARIRRERRLPTRGTVLAQSGARVSSLDVVAKSNTVGHLRAVPLARYLRTPEANLPKYLLKKPGDEIQARQVIASKPELFGTLQRLYRAPASGRIAAVQGAWLAMDLVDQPFELQALYRGGVVSVIPNLGVVIEATGALAQGIWGAGGTCYGVLKLMVDSPSAVLAEDQIDLSVRGTILVAGAGVTEEALRRAAQERAIGLIVGGLALHLRDLVTRLALPIVITEGWGERAMAAPIFELLRSRNDAEAVVNASSGARGAARPDVFIPVLPTGGAPIGPPPTLVAEVGAPVRLVSGAHLGETGKIAQVPAAPAALESGVLAWGAQVELISGSRLFVPWENLELIG
jgi:hypothetical protein